MKISTLAVATAGMLVMAGGASALTNLVSDGDFTTPSGGVTYTSYAAGSLMGPWNVTGTGSKAVDLIGGFWQPPMPGQGSVDLDGTQPGGIFQTLATLPDGTYTLQFDLSGNPVAGNPLKTVDVSVGNISNEAFTYLTGSNSKSSMDYVLERVFFTVTGGAGTTLTFDSADLAGSAYGPVIGNVGVFSGVIPEPATWGLMILGLGGLGAVARARRKTALA
ncbi:MAG: DUF642 domain-containing protein [Caulobacteraceae bacterium]